MKKIKKQQYLYTLKKTLLLAGISINLFTTFLHSNKENTNTLKEQKIESINTTEVPKVTNYEFLNSEMNIINPFTFGTNIKQTNKKYNQNLGLNITAETVTSSEYKSSPREIQYQILKNPKYYDIPANASYQQHILGLAEKYGIPEEISFTIGDVESGGTWATNGVVWNGNLGIYQVNRCNLAMLEEVFEYTEEEILNDPYKNAECAHYLLKIIFDLYGYTKDNYNFDNVCGTYNYWVLWESQDQAIEYVRRCHQAYEEKFSHGRKLSL